MTYQANPRVDEYISRFSPKVQQRLIKLRVAIQQAFPTTIEDISYAMPTYRPAPGKRGIVHFANFEKHIGLYAVFLPEEATELRTKLEPYNTGKGTLQFLHSNPFPIELITEALAYHAIRTNQ